MVQKRDSPVNEISDQGIDFGDGASVTVRPAQDLQRELRAMRPTSKFLWIDWLVEHLAPVCEAVQRSKVHRPEIKIPMSISLLADQKLDVAVTGVDGDPGKQYIHHIGFSFQGLKEYAFEFDQKAGDLKFLIFSHALQANGVQCGKREKWSHIAPTYESMHNQDPPKNYAPQVTTTTLV